MHWTGAEVAKAQRQERVWHFENTNSAQIREKDSSENQMMKGLPYVLSSWGVRGLPQRQVDHQMVSAAVCMVRWLFRKVPLTALGQLMMGWKWEQCRLLWPQVRGDSSLAWNQSCRMGRRAVERVDIPKGAGAAQVQGLTGLGVRERAVVVVKACPTLVTLWTMAHQAPLSMGFPRQETGVGFHFLLWEKATFQLTPQCQLSQSGWVKVFPRIWTCQWKTRKVLHNPGQVVTSWISGFWLRQLCGC